MTNNNAQAHPDYADREAGGMLLPHEANTVKIKMDLRKDLFTNPADMEDAVHLVLRPLIL